MTNLLSNPVVKKSYDGSKFIKEYKTFNGKEYQIYTSKSRSGLSCTAQQGKTEEKESYQTFTFMMFQDEFIRLIDNNLRATDKNLIDTHKAGLIILNQIMEERNK